MADKEKKVKASAEAKAESKAKSKAKDKEKAKADKSTGKQEKKPNFFVRMFKGIINFFKTFKRETKKVSWPDSKTVLKNTGIVLVMVLVIGVVIFGIDTGLSEIIMLIKKLASADTAFISSMFLM